MKRNYVLVILGLILMIGNNATAQTESRIGVTLGANYNNLHFKQNNLMDVNAGFGPIAGVTGELNFAGVGFALEGSLLYSLRSSKVKYGNHYAWAVNGYGNEMCRMHYIDVPLSLKFKYHKLNGLENTIMPMVFAGPTFSFLVGKNLGEVNKYHPVSVLLRMGVGAELCRRWQVQAAYSFSIGETLRTRVLDENIAKNRCWSVQLTYFFK